MCQRDDLCIPIGQKLKCSKNYIEPSQECTSVEGCSCIFENREYFKKYSFDSKECAKGTICLGFFAENYKSSCVRLELTDSQQCTNKNKCLCSSNKNTKRDEFLTIECEQNQYCFDLDSLKCIKSLITVNQKCNDSYCMCYKKESDFGKSVAERNVVEKNYSCSYSNDEFKILKVIHNNEKCSESSCACLFSDKEIEEEPSRKNKFVICQSESYCAIMNNELISTKEIIF